MLKHTRNTNNSEIRFYKKIYNEQHYTKTANMLDTTNCNKSNVYVIHQKFNHFTDVIGSVFVVTIWRITGEMAFISANFDVSISCSSIFVFKGIVYDIVHTRLELIMWDGSVQGRKIKRLNGSCFMDSQVA